MDDDARQDFAAYVQARSAALLRTAYLLTGNRADAEDLLQTALGKTYLAWNRLMKEHMVDAYVRRVMANTRISWWRKRRVAEYATDVLPERPTGDAFAGADLRSLMMSVLAELPPRQRAVVVLRYYEDMSEAEIADTLGISLGTVKSTASRALSALRERSVAAGLRDCVGPDGSNPVQELT